MRVYTVSKRILYNDSCTTLSVIDLALGVNDAICDVPFNASQEGTPAPTVVIECKDQKTEDEMASSTFHVLYYYYYYRILR